MGRTYSIDQDWEGPYIDGNWRTGHRDLVQVVNPATGESFTEVAFATVDDVDTAYEAASAAQSDWAEAPQERITLLEELSDLIGERSEEIAHVSAIETGRIPGRIKHHLSRCRSMLTQAASMPFEVRDEGTISQIPGKRNEIVYEPVGTIGVITPWNVPLALALRAIAPALALGNTVVLKPAPDTPITGGLILAEMFDELNAPEGVLNVLPGGGPDVGQRIVNHPEPSVISFTGSSEVGREIAQNAIRDFKFPALELGGNNPHIITDDSDLDLAIRAGAFASYPHSGQACISINRHLVHESLVDDYAEGMVEIAESLTIGDPLADGTDVGPVINEGQRDRIIEYIKRTIDEGAILHTGGDYDNLFVEPTVLTNVTNDMAAACNEHFGPVVPIISFEDDDEAVQLANDTDYGLAASVHARDVGRARSIADRLEVGMVHINDQTLNMEIHLPFGGRKASGFGRYNDRWIRDKLVDPKWISVQESPREYPI